MRLGLADVASSSELEEYLERIGRAIERLADRVGALEASIDKADLDKANLD